jgi:hypothetical protein
MYNITYCCKSNEIRKANSSSTKLFAIFVAEVMTYNFKTAFEIVLFNK